MSNGSGPDMAGRNYANFTELNGDTAISPGFTPMEPGDYTLVMIESDFVANASGNGMVAKLQCQVVGGEYDGRPYYINLNLEHENQQA